MIPDKINYAFIQGVIASHLGEDGTPHGNWGEDPLWKVGFQYMEAWKAAPHLPPDTLEGQMLQHIADEAWTSIIHGKGDPMLCFRIASYAEFMIEKLRGKIENDISFLDRVSYLKIFGLDKK